MAATNDFRFGKHFLKSSVVFFRSKFSIGFVNIKPVLPGHVLVSPIRVVQRFVDMQEEEVSDLFITTQKICRVIEKEFGSTSLSIAIQDGPEAGQTVPHVHVHILPRKIGDFEKNDDVYKALDEHDKDFASFDCQSPSKFSKTNLVSKSQGLRSEEEMEEEASRLALLFTSA